MADICRKIFFFTDADIRGKKTTSAVVTLDFGWCPVAERELRNESVGNTCAYQENNSTQLNLILQQGTIKLT